MDFDPTTAHPRLFAAACAKAWELAPDTPVEALAVMFRAGYEDVLRHRRKTRVGVEAKHLPEVVPAPKMDAPDLVAVKCSCGSYQSPAGDRLSAMKSWGQHAYAKL